MHACMLQLSLTMQLARAADRMATHHAGPHLEHGVVASTQCFNVQDAKVQNANSITKDEHACQCSHCLQVQDLVSSAHAAETARRQIQSLPYARLQSVGDVLVLVQQMLVTAADRVHLPAPKSPGACWWSVRQQGRSSKQHPEVGRRTNSLAAVLSPRTLLPLKQLTMRASKRQIHSQGFLVLPHLARAS
jgi:hypothetical protein